MSENETKKKSVDKPETMDRNKKPIGPDPEQPNQTPKSTPKDKKKPSFPSRPASYWREETKTSLPIHRAMLVARKWTDSTRLTRSEYENARDRWLGSIAQEK